MSTDAMQNSEEAPVAEHETKQSESLFRALVENSSDVIILNNAEGYITYVNPSITNLLGYTPAEFCTFHPSALIHPDDQQSATAVFVALLEQPGNSIMAQYRVCHKNGFWRWVEGTWKNLLTDPTVRSIMINIHDITERKRAEERQRVLNMVSELLVSSFNHTATLQEIASLLVPSLADYCRIAILDEQQQINTIVAHHFEPEKIALVQELYEQYKDRASSTAGLQRLLKNGQAELISSVTQEVIAPSAQENPRISSIINALGLRSYIGVPLLVREKIIGAITFSSIQPHHCYTQDDLAFAQEVARRIALALDNACLYQRAQEELAERKQVEEALRRSEERLQAIFMYASVGIAFTDAEGHFLQINPMYCKITGYSKEELLRMDFVSITHPDDLPENLRLIQEMAEGKISAFVLEKRYLRKGGGIVWAHYNVSLVRDVSGKVLYLIALIEDITDNKKAEEEHNRFAAIVESSNDAIIGKTLDGTITSWNRAAEQLFGYTAQEAIGQPITMIIPFHLYQEEKEIIRKLRQETHIRHYETTRQRKDGTLIDVSLSISPIKDSLGNIIGAAKIARDITERKELEQRKDDFISMASHELKTPVTSIKGFTQLLHRRFKQRDDEESLRFLSRMDVQLNKLTQLISDLLDISKMQTGRLEYREEPFELDALAQEIVENIQGTAQKHRVVLENPVPVRVFGDRDRIGQVLINLLTNAIKYSPEADKVLVQVTTDGTNAVMKVQDFGIGIAPAYQEKVFERFYQVNEPESKTYPGLGIGLYISKEIVERHQGRIEIHSRKGEGTTFSVILPLLS